MDTVKRIFVAALVMVFLGCKAERAETKKSSATEIVPAESAEKSEEKESPKKEYGGLYSDADLDRILKLADISRPGVLYSDADAAFVSRQDINDIVPVAYYYAGNRCADKGEYQEAAKLYAMAAAEFESSTYKYSKIRWESKWKESYPGTLDENGECKEFYIFHLQSFLLHEPSWTVGTFGSVSVQRDYRGLSAFESSAFRSRPCKFIRRASRRRSEKASKRTFCLR